MKSVMNSFQRNSYHCFSTHTKNNRNISAVGSPTAKTVDEHASSHDMNQVRNNQYGSHVDETLKENKADAPLFPSPAHQKPFTKTKTNPSSSLC